LLPGVVTGAMLWWVFNEDLVEVVIVGLGVALIAALLPYRPHERSDEQSGQLPR
jgi:hypothetical protein